MADIKQAATWLKARKRVRRHCWANGFSIKASSAYARIKDDAGEIAHMTPDELLADDWEIAHPESE